MKFQKESHICNFKVDFSYKWTALIFIFTLLFIFIMFYMPIYIYSRKYHIYLCTERFSEYEQSTTKEITPNLP